MHRALQYLSIAFAILTPVLLISTNARLAVNSRALYGYSINAYNAAQRTGVERDELLRANEEIIAYFNNAEERLDITVNLYGQPIALFNEREILHMADVKGLVRWLHRVQAMVMGLAIGFVVYAILNIALGRRWASVYLGRALLAGGAGTTALLVVVGGIAAVGGFRWLFLQFHFLSFSNDFWLLDPTRDRLVQMFTEPFFFDATMLIVGMTLLQALLFSAAGWLLIRRAQSIPDSDAAASRSRGKAAKARR